MSKCRFGEVFVSPTHPEPECSRGGVCSGVCGGVCLRVAAAVFAVFAGGSARRNASGALHLVHAPHHRLRLHLHRRRRHGLGAGQLMMLIRSDDHH